MSNEGDDAGMSDVQSPRPEGLHPDLPDRPVWPGWRSAMGQCLRFYSRLPVPASADDHRVPDFRLIPRALPLAALLIALPAALLLWGAGAAGLSPLLAASLAVTALVVATGAFHEDGLADSADGLFGGHTPERRLDIMKDSRVGSFGSAALILSLLLRASALASVLEAAGPAGTAAAILCAAPWSRCEALRHLANEPPARGSGAAAAVGRPSPATVAIALALSGAAGLGLAWLAGLPLAGFVLGAVLASLAGGGLAIVARRLIGGQTGDIAGACQQIGEIAIYLGFAIMLGAAG